MRWYLIYTKPAREQVAELNLLRQGYEVYHPRLVRPARLHGRWVEQVISLFPRYLFVRLDAGIQSMGPLRSTLGVANIVRFGRDYSVVADAIVENLRMRADSETGLHRLCGQASFEPGSKVRIVAGLFEGLEAVFCRESGDERVVLLLEVLGRCTHVEFPSGFVMPKMESRAKQAAR